MSRFELEMRYSTPPMRYLVRTLALLFPVWGVIFLVAATYTSVLREPTIFMCVGFGLGNLVTISTAAFAIGMRKSGRNSTPRFEDCIVMRSVTTA